MAESSFKRKPFLRSATEKFLDRKPKSTSKGKNRRAKLDEEDVKIGIDYILEKVTELSSSKPWAGSDLLYWTEVTKRPKAHQLQVKKPGIKYLIVYYNPETLKGYLLYVSCHGKDVEIKLSWQLSEVKGLDVGETPHEFILTAETDYIWVIPNGGDRDECLWILLSICRNICGLEVTSGYAIDMDTIGSSVVNNGALSPFPQLLKHLESKLASLSLSDSLAFTAEEAEAEQLFEELHWGASDGGAGDPSDLKRSLKAQSEQLQVEICDFLLQWEEEDISADVVAASKSGQAAYHQSVRDTMELLRALDQVDTELGHVSEWLGLQINHLSEVQRELFQIESENSALETSWHNLSAVQRLITSLLEELTLLPEHEKVLQHPEIEVQRALSKKSLDDSETTLKPLVAALENLQAALARSRSTSTSTSIPPEEWIHLQSMSIVVQHKQRLMDLTDTVCEAMNDISMTLFSQILEHKSLQDTSSKKSIVLKHVALTPIVDDINDLLSEYMANNNAPSLSLCFTSSAGNQLLSCQRVFHENVYPFLPVIEMLSDLNPTLAEQFQKSYVTSTQSSLYGPIIKQLFKELHSSVPPRTNILNLANMPKSSAMRKSDPQLILTHGVKSTKAPANALASWNLLPVVMCLAGPVIQRELTFLQQVIFRQTDSDAKVATRCSEALEDLFSVNLRERVLKLAQSAEYVDGLEIVALLVMLDMTSWAIVCHSDMAGGNEDDAAWNYVLTMIMDVKTILTRRHTEFMTTQIAWIHQQRADPKKGGILLPFAKFPALADQFVEIAADKDYEFIDTNMQSLCHELVVWLQNVASQNEKYADAVLIQNLTYLEESIRTRRIKCLQRFAQVIMQQRKDAEVRYVNWMVAYEFPVLHGISEKMKGVGRRATEEEMSLYIRRDEVMKAVGKLEGKTIEISVITMLKRLDKHFGTEASELNIISKLRILLKDTVLKMFELLEKTSLTSYQITLGVTAANVEAMFDKIMS